MSQDEQQEFIINHPGTRLRTRIIDVPIGQVQKQQDGQYRLMTDEGWKTFDKDHQEDFINERTKIDSFLQSKRFNRGYRT